MGHQQVQETQRRSASAAAAGERGEEVGEPGRLVLPQPVHPELRSDIRVPVALGDLVGEGGFPERGGDDRGGSRGAR